MKTYTAHIKPARVPVLVREGWSWGAALFGPLWLLARRAWIAAVLQAVLVFALLGAVPDYAAWPVLGAAMFLSGLLGRDLVRWSLARRGYVLTHVLAARNEDSALARLLTARADLLPRYTGRAA